MWVFLFRASSWPHSRLRSDPTGNPSVGQCRRRCHVRAMCGRPRVGDDRDLSGGTCWIMDHLPTYLLGCVSGTLRCQHNISGSKNIEDLEVYLSHVLCWENIVVTEKFTLGLQLQYPFWGTMNPNGSHTIMDSQNFRGINVPKPYMERPFYYFERLKFW